LSHSHHGTVHITLSMSSAESWLVLSIAHRPLDMSLLSELLERSASTTFRLLQRAKAINDRNAASHMQNMDTDDDATQSYEDVQHHPTVHVNLTGSTSILTPGRSHIDWEKKWSEGEWVFSRLVGKIGPQHFQRLPKPGETRLSARLVDLNLSNFSGIISQREKILKELTHIAIRVLQNFVLCSAKPIDNAIILCPFGEEEEALMHGKEELVDIIRHVFRSTWSEKEGPLNGVDPQVEIVSVLELESELNCKRRCIRGPTI